MGRLEGFVWTTGAVVLYCNGGGGGGGGTGENPFVKV